MFCCFAYNDHFSQHRSLKQRTWTHSCHSHVIASKPCAQHRQRTKKPQWSEKQMRLVRSDWLIIPYKLFIHLIKDRKITKCPYLHWNRSCLHWSFLLFILVIKRSQKWSWHSRVYLSLYEQHPNSSMNNWNIVWRLFSANFVSLCFVSCGCLRGSWAALEGQWHSLTWESNFFHTLLDNVLHRRPATEFLEHIHSHASPHFSLPWKMVF